MPKLDKYIPVFQTNCSLCYKQLRKTRIEWLLVIGKNFNYFHVLANFFAKLRIAKQTNKQKNKQRTSNKTVLLPRSMFVHLKYICRHQNQNS